MNSDALSNLVITGVHSALTLYTPGNKKRTITNRKRWAVVIKYEGETFYFSNGKRFLSDSNHLLILPKGCTYDWQCTEAGHFSIIEFDSDLVADEPLQFFVKNSDKILKMLKDLEYKRNVKSPTTDMESIRDTYAVILALVRSEYDRYLPTQKYDKIAPAIDYISRNYDKALTNDFLAELCGLSTVYFRKLFTEIVGKPPMLYAREMRLEKAKAMLRSDYATLSDVAQSLGYISLYDFSRDFKKHTGIPPSKY